MTSRDFCYWLQGFIEVTEEGLAERSDQQLTGLKLNPKQVASIRKHLDLVFKHEIDPSMGDKPHQDKLNAIHGGYPSPDKTAYKIRC